MTKHRLQRKKPSLLALEARFMFDGAAVDTAIAVVDQAIDLAPSEPESASVTPDSVEQASLSHQAFQLTTGTAEPNARREIAFIDSSVQNWGSLVSGISTDVEIVLIDARGDGLTQMVNYLDKRTDIDAIHWLTHGQAGVAVLGDLNLDIAKVAERTSDLRKIGTSLTSEGDFLLYACDLAAGDVGLQLIGEIARVTGADVAASRDATGSATYGGNWVLESSIGTIETSSFAITDYDGVFALPGAHSNTTSGQVFIGGNYIEVGIQTNGKFGASPGPSGFLGRQAGLSAGIGMVGDADGFGVGTDLRVDYFLPGSPEEGFYAGYKIAGVPAFSKNFASSVTNTTLGDALGAQIIATLVSNLKITQDISFDVNDKFFKNVVTLENISLISLDSVRFMRSFDPDNTVDLSGSYSTINAVDRSIAAGDGVAVSSATSISGDNYYNISGNKQARIIYYSSDPRARGSFATSGLAPSNIYDANIYDSAHVKGDTATADAYISIAVDVGTLASGESTTFTYYTSLDNRDIESILGDIAAADNTTLTSITEDPVANSGETVSAIFDSAIAVTVVDNTNGVWQYSADGSTWLDFSATTGSSVDIATTARLLSTTYSIKFIPNADYNGSATISYRVWSGNGFTAGNTADASSGGGEFSSNAANAILNITAVNDAPVLGGALQTLAYTENNAATAIDTVITVSDVDTNTFNTGFIKAELTTNGALEDQLSVLHQGTGVGQIGVSGSTVSYAGTTIGTIDGSLNGVNNTALKITLNSNATTAATQALARVIAYRNTSEHPSILSRTLTFTFNDGGNTGSGGALETTHTATINVTRANDAPVNDVAPTISGGCRTYSSTLRQDGVLTANPGTWHDVDLSDPATTYRYQWQVADDAGGTNLADISGATSVNYTVTSADIGKYIRVKVFGSDGTVETIALSTYTQVTNQDPSAHGPLDNKEVTESQSLTYILPTGAFTDPDAEDTLYYSATLVSGAPLPGWLRFDPITRTFSGTPTGADAGTIRVKVTATDHGLNPVMLEFSINVLSLPPVAQSPVNKTDAPTQSTTATTVVKPADPNSGGQTREFLNEPSSTLNVNTVESVSLPNSELVNVPVTTQQVVSSIRVNNDTQRLTREEGFRILASSVAGQKVSLSLAHPMIDEFIKPNMQIKLIIPIDTFVHTDPNAIIRLEATMLDGQPLPAWLKFDALKGEFYGIVPNGIEGDIELKVKATDNFGQAVTTKFKIKVKAKNDNIVNFSGREGLSTQMAQVKATLR